MFLISKKFIEAWGDYIIENELSENNRSLIENFVQGAYLFAKGNTDKGSLCFQHVLGSIEDGPIPLTKDLIQVINSYSVLKETIQKKEVNNKVRYYTTPDIIKNTINTITKNTKTVQTAEAETIQNKKKTSKPSRTNEFDGIVEKRLNEKPIIPIKFLSVEDAKKQVKEAALNIQKNLNALAVLMSDTTLYDPDGGYLSKINFYQTREHSDQLIEDCLKPVKLDIDKMLDTDKNEDLRIFKQGYDYIQANNGELSIQITMNEPLGRMLSALKPYYKGRTVYDEIGVLRYTMNINVGNFNLSDNGYSALSLIYTYLKGQYYRLIKDIIFEKITKANITAEDKNKLLKYTFGKSFDESNSAIVAMPRVYYINENTSNRPASWIEAIKPYNLKSTFFYLLYRSGLYYKRINDVGNKQRMIAVSRVFDLGKKWEEEEPNFYKRAISLITALGIIFGALFLTDRNTGCPGSSGSDVELIDDTKDKKILEEQALNDLTQKKKEEQDKKEKEKRERDEAKNKKNKSDVKGKKDKGTPKKNGTSEDAFPQI